MLTLRDITSWPDTQLVDRYGEKLGKLQHVYVDVETNKPVFGSVKKGRMGRNLTFVPLHAITIGPDHMQVKTTEDEMKDALEIKEGHKLSQADESCLYHHYGLNYTPTDTESGCRLARR